MFKLLLFGLSLSRKSISFTSNIYSLLILLYPLGVALKIVWYKYLPNVAKIVLHQL